MQSYTHSIATPTPAPAAASRTYVRRSSTCARRLACVAGLLSGQGHCHDHAADGAMRVSVFVVSGGNSQQSSHLYVLAPHFLVSSPFPQRVPFLLLAAAVPFYGLAVHVVYVAVS